MEGSPQPVPWRKIKRWMCIHCGFCCSEYDVPVTLNDEVRLRKYGNVFKRGKIGLYLRKKKGKCVFRGKGGCKIYDERPMACKKYPFYIMRQGDQDSLFIYNGKVYHVFLDARCSGLGKGDDVEEEIRKLLRDLKDSQLTGCLQVRKKQSP
jgi:hypothetical protein